MTDAARGLVGIVGLLVIAWLLSLNRRAIRPRVVVAALACQVAIGAVILFVPAGKAALSAIATGVNHVLAYGNKGIEFTFGGLVSPTMFEVFGGVGFVFALRVLPAIIFVTALISVLYHLGVMRWVVAGLGLLSRRSSASRRSSRSPRSRPSSSGRARCPPRSSRSCTSCAGPSSSRS